jgi:Kdo2-lipid IVA lauroyltransferase/acyltransferase
MIQRWKNNCIYVAVCLLLACAKRIPRRMGLVLFGRIGLVLRFFAASDRRRTLEQLDECYRERLPQSRIRAMARQVYIELGKNAFDALYLSRGSKAVFDRLVTCDNLDEFKSAYGEGKGVVCFIAHLGCFEMLLHYFARAGFRCTAVGQRLYDSRLDAIVKDLRSGPNITYMHRSGSAREIVRLLSGGHVLGVLVDQDTNIDGVFARFLGRLAHTPSAAMRLAMRFDIPALVVTTARQPDGTHKIFVSKRIPLENTGNGTRDLVVNIQKVNDLINAAIERNPEQWVWMHRRWRKQPADPQYAGIPNIERYETNSPK